MHEPRQFDYVAYIVKKMHEGFLSLHNNLDKSFKFYSLLMHIIMFYGRHGGLWPEDLKLNIHGKDGQEKPVQLWVSLWDSWFMRSHYVKFEDFFVQPLYRVFGVSFDGSFSKEIKRFLRPHEHGDTKVNHNWGDWYIYRDFTYVRVFGFKGAPYVLPKPAPNRIAYLEIVRQMNVSNAQHFGGTHKQVFLLETLHFGDFTIVSTKAYEIIDRRLIEDYNLYEHTSQKIMTWRATYTRAERAESG